MPYQGELGERLAQERSIPDDELGNMMRRNQGLTTLYELIGTWAINVETWIGTDTEVKIFRTQESGERKYLAKIEIPECVSELGKPYDDIERGGNVKDLLEKMIKKYIKQCRGNYKSPKPN